MNNQEKERFWFEALRQGEGREVANDFKVPPPFSDLLTEGIMVRASMCLRDTLDSTSQIDKITLYSIASAYAKRKAKFENKTTVSKNPLIHLFKYEYLK